MLGRLKRDTQAQETAADEGRLEPLRTSATQANYTTYLARIYGFEAPIEAAFAEMTELAQLVDLRWRSQVRLLKADLGALGIIDATLLPLAAMTPFSSIAEALGWLYVVEQSAVVHGQLRRHFVRWLPEQAAAAGCYLLGGERAVGTRLAELGTALDDHAREPEIATRIVEAARAGFRRQRHWFAQRSPPFASTQLGSS